MPDDPLSLQQLLAPVPVRKFLREYREKKSLHLRGASREKFSSLLTLAEVDQMLAAGYLRHPDCKLVKDGGEIPVARYLIGEPVAGAINLDAVYGEYRKGATIVVNGLQKHWRPLAEFCRGLEAGLSVPIQANIYLTPKGSQGFAAHYDGHDVLVLQIAGKKHWRLHGSPVVLPTDRQPFSSSTVAAGPIRQRCTLRPGDLLYIPRGLVHDATAANEASLHITVGIGSTSWGDVLVEALRLLIESDPELRTSLPPRFAGATSTPRAVQRTLERVKKKVATRLPLNAALDELADRFVTQRVQWLDGQLVDLEKSEPIGLDSPLARRSRVLFRWWKERGKVGLIFHRKKIVFPAFVAPALKFITETAAFRPAELPGRMTKHSKLVLCRRLVEEGFLRTNAP